MVSFNRIFTTRRFSLGASLSIRCFPRLLTQKILISSFNSLYCNLSIVLGFIVSFSSRYYEFHIMMKIPTSLDFNVDATHNTKKAAGKPTASYISENILIPFQCMTIHLRLICIDSPGLSPRLRARVSSCIVGIFIGNTNKPTR
ncbi:hypothetical protein D3C73_710530 [compost metagenome]